MDDYASSVPELSVLVTTHRGEDHLGTCLASLAAQTLDRSRFEVVVVQNGPAGRTAEVVADVVAAHPDLVVRQVSMTRPGAGHARNVALQTARGRYLTFVDDDDWVGEAYLERLLGAAGPNVVVVAPIADVVVRDGVVAEPSFDNYYARALRRWQGQVVAADDLRVALEPNAAKLVPAAAARRARYREDLHSGEDFLYWLEVVAATSLRLRVIRIAPGVAYNRVVRAGSVGRQGDTFAFSVQQRLDCVAALAEVERTRPAIARLVDGMQRAQGDHVNEYLRRHPEEHRRVVDAVRERGLYDVPWPAINSGLAEDLAILYCFTPYLDTSGLVAARRLRERGLVTDVVSHSLADIRPRDPLAQRVAAEVVDRTRILPGKANFVGWPAILEFTEQALATVSELEAVRGRGYRSVYSRAMAVNSHFAAAALKLQQPHLTWTAEISDPLLRNPLGEDRVNDMRDDWLHHALRAAVAQAGFPQPPELVKLFAWAELVPYALADEIVFTNELQREFMLDYLPDKALGERARSVSRVSHHPTLPRAYYDMVDADHDLSGPDVVDIGYFGVFYASRGLTEVTGALRSLSLADRRHVRLHVFTDRHEKLAEEVLREGLADVIRVRPYVPYLTFLNLTTKLDALLVNDAATAGHHGVNPYLPSKISDYRGSGTPIWAIVEPGSMLSREQTTYSSVLGDVDGARRVLEQLIRDHVTPPVAPARLAAT